MVWQMMKHPAVDRESNGGRTRGTVRLRVHGPWKDRQQHGQDWGPEMRFTLVRTGHLVTGIGLDLTVKRIGDAELRADQLIRNVVLEIGGEVVERFDGSWFEVYNALHRSASERQGYAKMSGFDAVDDGVKKLHLPLPFFFSEDNPLPLVDLKYHEVTVTVNFQTRAIRASAGFDNEEGCLVEASANYVFLSEATLAIPRPTELTIEYTQSTGTEWVVPSTSKLSPASIPLYISGPTKYVAWTVRGDDDNLPHETYLTLDGVPTAYRRDAAYFNGQHPWERFGTTLPRGMYVDTLGSVVNFNRVDDAEVVISPPDGKKWTVNVYARSVKKMLIKDGLAVPPPPELYHGIQGCILPAT